MVRRIQGQHKIDSLMRKSNHAVLNAALKSMHKVILAEVETILTKSLADISNGALVNLINANEHLSDTKKAQILSILDLPDVNNQRSYLG